MGRDGAAQVISRRAILRVLAWALALPVVASAVVGPGCADDEGRGAGASAEAPYDADGHLLTGRRARTASPDVVLIVIDTTRRDAIDSLDGRPPVMPALRRFCEASTWFHDASSQASWTAPSVTTILTGLAPWHHGVHGHFRTPPLSSQVATLAEYLSAIGYDTAALSGGGWVSPAMGHGQGIRVDRFGENWSFEDPRGELERFVARRDPEKPLFLLLHTYEAHDPYGRKFPPEGHDDPARVAEVNAEVRRIAERVGPDPEAEVPLDLGVEFLVRLRADPLFHQALANKIGRSRVLRAITTYDREVLAGRQDRRAAADRLRVRYLEGLARVDGHFERLLTRLAGLGLSKNRVTIVATDHGESFDEHDDLGHGRWLYDELSRVVLAIDAPGRLPAAKRVPGACGLVDVVPTVLDLVGLPPPAGIDGRSLVRKAGGTGTQSPVLAEEFRLKGTGAGKVEVRVRSVRTERAKWIGTFDPSGDAVEEEVYDLAADPGETRPLPATALADFGPDFVAAVEQSRLALRSLSSRQPR